MVVDWLRLAAGVSLNLNNNKSNELILDGWDDGRWMDVSLFTYSIPYTFRYTFRCFYLAYQVYRWHLHKASCLSSKVPRSRWQASKRGSCPWSFPCSVGTLERTSGTDASRVTIPVFLPRVSLRLKEVPLNKIFKISIDKKFFWTCVMKSCQISSATYVVLVYVLNTSIHVEEIIKEIIRNFKENIIFNNIE